MQNKKSLLSIIFVSVLFVSFFSLFGSQKVYASEDFVSLGQGAMGWYGISVDSSNNNVYAVVRGGDIYKQTGGVGNFVALSQTSRSWTNISVDSSNNNVYATVDGGDIYKQTGGVGNFVALGQTPRYWSGISVDSSNHNVYTTSYNPYTYVGDIYKQTGGVGNFVALGQDPGITWGNISVDSSNQNVYVTVRVTSGNGIYKQTGGVGNFNLVSINQPERYWLGISVDSSNHNVYAVVYNNDIYKMTFPFDLTAGSSLPSSVSVGTPLSFTSTIYNISGNAVTDSFFNFFQVATDPNNDATISDLAATSMSGVDTFEIKSVTSPIYNFTSVGTFYIRACADKSSALDPGLITESNENNNCGPWTIVDVGPVAATANIKADGSDGPKNITSGDLVDITWTSFGATSCFVTPPNWTGTSASAGTHLLNIFSTVTYRIYCDPPAGGSEDDLVVVNVASRHDLTLIKSGLGTVTSTSVPNQVKQINCGPNCTTQTISFSSDTAVSLHVAVVPPGRIFTGWRGDCSGKGSCDVLINGPKTVFANFFINPIFRDF
jgi:hypothetical protein